MKMFSFTLPMIKHMHVLFKKWFCPDTLGMGGAYRPEAHNVSQQVSHGVTMSTNNRHS